jgi:hypothetical protein
MLIFWDREYASAIIRTVVAPGMFTDIEPLSAGMLIDASLRSPKEASEDCLRENGLEEPCVSTCCLMLLQCDASVILSCQTIGVLNNIILL